MDISLPAIRQRLAAFRRRCAALGLALTPQRLAIYEALAGDDSHPSAADVYNRIKPALPSLSLGTVYRTLELFERQGLVARVHVAGDEARFDAHLDDHQHLVCVRCRRVIDFQDPRLQRLPVPKGLPGGFRVLSQRLHLLGLCRACQR
jgi:Fur family peroxide stress response transcriptional regulator